METRSFEIRAVDKDARIVSGIAVPYGSTENGERFEHGAAVLEEGAKLFAEHSTPIGKIIEGKQTDEGLFVRAYISTTAKGDEYYTLLKDGVIDRMSVGFDKAITERDAEGVTVVKSARVREVSLVPFAWYHQGAKISEVREEPQEEATATAEVTEAAPAAEENESNTVTDNTDALTEIRESVELMERAVAELQKPAAAPATDMRSAGEFLKAVAAGEEQAVRVYTGAVLADSVSTPIDNNLIRLVEGANPLGTVFGRGVVPADGMTITYARVSGIVDNTGEQAAEGDALGYYELQVDTDTENIAVVGNYAELSRMAIDRSSVPYLDSVLRGQAIALGQALAADLRNKYTATVSAQAGAGALVTRASEDYAGWAGALADAQATYFAPNGATVDALIVSKATFKALLALDGNPVITFAGEANGAAGSANVAGLRGSIAGVPIIVDAQLAANGTEDAFVSSIALRQYVTPTLRLSQEDAIHLTEAFSLSVYTATAAEFPALIVPVVAA
jgi:uncharacterized protein